jgi:hypothetical protein
LELEERKLIEVDRPKDRSKSVTVTIIDVWLENFQHFSERSQDERSVHHMNTECSPHERRNKPYKEVKDTNVSSRGTAADASATGSEKQEKAKQEYDHILADNGKLGKKLSLFVESAAQQRNKTGELKPTTKLRDYAEPFVSAFGTLSQEQLAYGLDAAIRNKAKKFGYVLAAAEGYDPKVHERFKRGPVKPQNAIAVTNVSDADYDQAAY